MEVGIILTAIAILGIVVAIFCIFFQAKNPIKVTKKDMVVIIIWLVLLSLGIANLMHMRSENNVDSNEQSKGAVETEFHEISVGTEERNSEWTDLEDMDINLSEDEQLIERNSDLIQKLKSEYNNEDTKIIENDSVNIEFNEISGYVYKNLSKTDECDILAGIGITPVKVLILDYSKDDIIYSYSPKNNTVIYYPDDQNKFYCVVFCDDYDIYVSYPIETIGGDGSNNIEINLDKKGSEYTSLFQLRLNMRSLKSEEQFSLVSEDYAVKYTCINLHSDGNSSSYLQVMSNNGMLSPSGFDYISLNTNYVMDISLYKSSDLNELLAQQRVNGIAENTNLIDIYFDLDNENDIVN